MFNKILFSILLVLILFILIPNPTLAQVSECQSVTVSSYNIQPGETVTITATGCTSEYVDIFLWYDTEPGSPDDDESRNENLNNADIQWTTNPINTLGRYEVIVSTPTDWMNVVGVVTVSETPPPTPPTTSGYCNTFVISPESGPSSTNFVASGTGCPKDDRSGEYYFQYTKPDGNTEGTLSFPFPSRNSFSQTLPNLSQQGTYSVYLLYKDKPRTEENILAVNTFTVTETNQADCGDEVANAEQCPLSCPAYSSGGRIVCGQPTFCVAPYSCKSSCAPNEYIWSAGNEECRQGGNDSAVCCIPLSTCTFPNTCRNSCLAGETSYSTGNNECRQVTGNNAAVCCIPPAPTSYADADFLLCAQLDEDLAPECLRCVTGLQDIETIKTIPPQQLKEVAGVWTAFGCIPTARNSIVKTVIRLGLSLAGGFALIFIIFGSFSVVTSQGNPEKLQHSKEIVTSALVGLLFIILSMAILQFIGVQILQIPQL